MKWTLRAAMQASCLALLLSSTARRAEAAELRVEWNAPPPCPSASDLRAHAIQLMGGVVRSDLVAEIKVTRREGAYHAHIVLRGPSGFGERHIEDARCDVLADSVAVLIALSVPSPVTTDSGADLVVTATPEVGVLTGSLPRLAAGIGGAIAVEGVASLRLEAHGAYYFPQSSTFSGMALGGRFELITIGACLCRLWSVGRIQGGPCVGAEIHHVSASGFGGSVQLPGSTIWWGPSLRLFGRANLWSWLAIDLAVEGMVPVSRPRFVFSDVGELHRVAAGSLRVSAGPEVRF
jgi:hypothetical protein